MKKNFFALFAGFVLAGILGGHHPALAFDEESHLRNVETLERQGATQWTYRYHLIADNPLITGFMVGTDDDDPSGYNNGRGLDWNLPFGWGVELIENPLGGHLDTWHPVGYVHGEPPPSSEWQYAINWYLGDTSSPFIDLSGTKELYLSFRHPWGPQDVDWKTSTIGGSIETDWADPIGSLHGPVHAPCDPSSPLSNPAATDAFTAHPAVIQPGVKHGQANIINRVKQDVMGLFEVHGTGIEETGTTKARATTAHGGTDIVEMGPETLLRTQEVTGPAVEIGAIGVQADSQAAGEYAQSLAGIELTIDGEGNLLQTIYAEAYARVDPGGPEHLFAEAVADATKEISYEEWDASALFAFEYNLSQVLLGADPEGILRSGSEYFVSQSTDISGLEQLWSLSIESDLDETGGNALVVDFTSHESLNFNDLLIEQDLLSAFWFDPAMDKWVFTDEDFTLLTQLEIEVDTWTWLTHVHAYAYAEYTPTIPLPGALWLLGSGLFFLLWVRRSSRGAGHRPLPSERP